METEDLTIDWNRCIHVTGRIDDELLKRLTPQILKLRQESNSPITVAIDSFGGSVAVIDSILGLVTGPDQNGLQCIGITVVTNEAFSAAAGLLTFGDYAVALPHSSILLHDLRYGGMEDVTPDKAKNAARQLQSANESFALRLANVVFRRLTWVYIDVGGTFPELRKDNKTYERYKAAIDTCGVIPTNDVEIDVAALAATMHRHLSFENRKLLDAAVLNLKSWATAMNAAKSIPMYKDPDGTVGLLDGALNLYKVLKPDHAKAPPFGADLRAEDIRLFIVVAMAQFASSKGDTGGVFERTYADFSLMQSINDKSHMHTASRLMLRHSAAFFSFDAQRVLDGDDEVAKRAVMSQVQPYVKVLWHLCVLLCKELVTGDHTLKPVEAIVLGLIDEVPGDSTIESRRQFKLKMMAQRALQAKTLPT